MKKKTILISILIVLIIAFIFAIIFGSKVWFLLTENTIYAQGYFEERFNLVRMGDSEDKVNELLPVPIKQAKYKTLLIYSYSIPEGNSNYKRRQIVLENGVVVEIRKEDYYD